jgi:hypothetical protein
MRSFHALITPARSRTLTMAKAVSGYRLDSLNRTGPRFSLQNDCILLTGIYTRTKIKFLIKKFRNNANLPITSLFRIKTNRSVNIDALVTGIFPPYKNATFNLQNYQYRRFFKI